MRISAIVESSKLIFCLPGIHMLYLFAGGRKEGLLIFLVVVWSIRIACRGALPRKGIFDWAMNFHRSDRGSSLQSQGDSYRKLSDVRCSCFRDLRLYQGTSPRLMKPFHFLKMCISAIVESMVWFFVAYHVYFHYLKMRLDAKVVNG